MTEFEKGLAEVLRPIVGEVHLPAASAAAAYVRAHLASDAVVERAAFAIEVLAAFSHKQQARAALAAVME